MRLPFRPPSPPLWHSRAKALLLFLVIGRGGVLIGKNNPAIEETQNLALSAEANSIAGMETGRLLSTTSPNHTAFQHCREFPAYAAKGSAKVGATAETVCHSRPLYEDEFEEFLGGAGQLDIEEVIGGIEGNTLVEMDEIAEAYNIETVLLQLAEPEHNNATTNTEPNLKVTKAKVTKAKVTITSMAAAGRKSIFRGVSRTAGGKWGAKYAGKRIPGASACTTEEEAAHKYDAFLKEHAPHKYLKFRNFCGGCGKFCSPRCSSTSTTLALDNLCVCAGSGRKKKQGKRKATASLQPLIESASTNNGIRAFKKVKSVAEKSAGAAGHRNTYQQLKQLLLATGAMDPNHSFAALVMTQKSTLQFSGNKNWQSR